jgi:hypothetical protein
MAQTGYLILDSVESEKYFSILRSGDRFISSRVNRKVGLMSVRRKKGFSQKSLLPFCALEWSYKSEADKLLWKTAGSFCNLSGWQCFVRDQCYCVINNIEQSPNPSEYFQGLCGKLEIEAPANELKIFQPHPYQYYVSQKVVGTKSMRSPVLVTEKLVLPLQIGLTYLADLEKTHEDGFAKFYAIVRRLYQGNNIDEVLEIDLILKSGFNTVTAQLDSVLGQYTSYSLYFHLYHLTGRLLVDNIKSIHSSQNWCRDASCQDIHQDFTLAFYQVPAHWSALTLPEGSSFESFYFNVPPY